MPHHCRYPGMCHLPALSTLDRPSVPLAGVNLCDRRTTMRCMTALGPLRVSLWGRTRGRWSREITGDETGLLSLRPGSPSDIGSDHLKQLSASDIGLSQGGEATEKR